MRLHFQKWAASIALAGTAVSTVLAQDTMFDGVSGGAQGAADRVVSIAKTVAPNLSPEVVFFLHKVTVKDLNFLEKLKRGGKRQCVGNLLILFRNAADQDYTGLSIVVGEDNNVSHVTITPDTQAIQNEIVRRFPEAEAEIKTHRVITGAGQFCHAPDYTV